MKKLLFIIFYPLLLVACDKASLDTNYKVIAHRGYWKMADGADNSILGLKEALRLGVDGVELDVCKTRDDSLLVVHGLFHGGHHIPTTDYNTLRSVRLSDGELVPTFDEYLKNAIKYNIVYFVEIKMHGEELQVLQKLDHYDYRYKVKLCSFSSVVCETLLEMDSKLYVAYINGDKTPSELKEKGYCGMHYDIIDWKKHPEWINEGKSLGLEASAWVIKTESDIIWCASHGIEYLIADNPLETVLFRSGYE